MSNLIYRTLAIVAGLAPLAAPFMKWVQNRKITIEILPWATHVRGSIDKVRGRMWSLPRLKQLVLQYLVVEICEPQVFRVSALNYQEVIDMTRWARLPERTATWLLRYVSDDPSFIFWTKRWQTSATLQFSLLQGRLRFWSGHVSLCSLIVDRSPALYFPWHLDDVGVLFDDLTQTMFSFRSMEKEELFRWASTHRIEPDWVRSCVEEFYPFGTGWHPQSWIDRTRLYEEQTLIYLVVFALLASFSKRLH